MEGQQTISAPAEVEQDIPQQQDAPPTPEVMQDTGGGQQPTPAQKLYDQLNKGQLYTKSFDDFQKQFSTPAAIDKLYQNLNDSKLYTKDKDSFYGQFFPNSKNGNYKSSVDNGISQTTQRLTSPIQLNGTFQPDIEGEKKGYYLNDPDYQKQKSDFTGRILTDENGVLNYPEQDKSGNWYNYYTKRPLINFDPQSMQGKILQVPHAGMRQGIPQFITPKFNSRTGSYDFPKVQTPDVPTITELPAATVYGPVKSNNDITLTPTAQKMAEESVKQRGNLLDVFKEHPELMYAVEEARKKYGEPYDESINAGSEGMTSALIKAVEDKYGLNTPPPSDINMEVLNGHLNILNNFNDNKKLFEKQQDQIQTQANLLVDHAKRTGEPVDQAAIDALNDKQNKNIETWNNYTKAVNFAKNYVQQPSVQKYISSFPQRKKGLDIIDEINQRAFPEDVHDKELQDEYDRKAIDKQTNVWDYLNAGIGKLASTLSNVASGAIQAGSAYLDANGFPFTAGLSSAAERINNNNQQFLNAYLPSISPIALKQMDKLGISHFSNDLSTAIGSFAPYIIPGSLEGKLASKTATGAMAFAEQLPVVKKEAEDLGLTGKAFSTYITAKPLINAAFMTLLPNAKFAKGYENDIAQSIVNGEFNSPRRMLLNLGAKILKDPEDVVHLQAMLSGTAVGDAAVNALTNDLQKSEDIKRGIVRNGDSLPTDISGIFDPRKTAVMEIAGKIMESVPTAGKAIGDLKYRDLASAYEHSQNNLIELAADNLQAVVQKADQLIKENQGNLYAQHIKNTLQEFAKAELSMPSDIVPAQKAALFDIQTKINRLQAQQGRTFADWKDGIQKNIDELKKQIPAVLKDEDGANKYLEKSHTELVNQIQSSKTENDGKEAENSAAQTEGGQVTGKPEGADKSGTVAAPIPITIDKNFRTLDYGNNKGQPETSEAKSKIDDEIRKDLPIGQTGERFSDFLGRILPAFRKLMDDSPHNTVLVTHSSVIKALKVWEEMGRPAKLNQQVVQKFANRYVELSPEKEGKVNTFSSDNGNDIKVVRHGETEDNKMSEFRDDSTQLTDKGISQAGKASENIIKETGGKVPGIVASDMPRTIRTSEIIHQKLQDHALQIGSPEKVLQREQGSAGETGSGRGRVEPSQQGEGLAGESGQQPAKEESESEGQKEGVDDLPFIEEEGDNEVTSTRNAVTKRKIEEMGLEPAAKEAAREFGTVWQQAQKKINKGFDVEKLIRDLNKKPRSVTDLENAMILFHQTVKEAQLADASKDLDAARKSGNRADWTDAYNRRAKLLDDLQEIYNADKAIGRETARGLNARKMLADRRFSLTNMELEKRAANGGDPLTEEQHTKLQKQYEDIKSAKEALDERVQELEKENARLQAENEVARQNKSTGKVRKTKEQFNEERKSIVKNMRADLLKAAKGGEGLTSSIPLAAQLKAVAPHIKDLVKSFIEEGVDKLEDITKNIMDLLKPDMPNIEERHVHDLISGEYGIAHQEKPDSELSEKELSKRNSSKAKAKSYTDVKDKAAAQKYIQTDPKLLTLQADYERAKDSYMQGLKSDQDKTRSNWDKLSSSFVKYERAIKLSNPVTLGKLTAAALTRLATTPIEEGVGGFYSALLPGLAKKAPGEAGIHVKALAKGYRKAFMQGIKDAGRVIKGDKTDIEAVYGKKGTPSHSMLDFFGQLHSALKAPVKQFAFERAFQKRMANNIKNGTPIDDLVIARIAMESYKDAERSIFMQDNPVSRGWTQAMNALERSGASGKTAATIGKWLIPFVKVPTNILGETISHVVGPEVALGKIISTSLSKGFKNMDQDEAESIMRNLKKGTIGHIALVAGYLNPQVFGGYYERGEKRKPGDVKVGDMKIGDVNIPAWALEAPLFQAMQLGATIRRVKDELVKGHEKGIGEGVWSGMLGLMSHEPLIDEPSRLGGMLASPEERKYFIGELAKSSFIPSVSEYAAKVSDPADTRSLGEKMLEPENKRQPTTIPEHIESAIPGLRENTPVKQPKRRHQHAPRHTSVS